MKEVFCDITQYFSLISSMNSPIYYYSFFDYLMYKNQTEIIFLLFAFGQLSTCTSLDGRHIVSRNCYDTPFIAVRGTRMESIKGT